MAKTPVIVIVIVMTMTMIDELGAVSFLRLQTWMSPVFPVGGFAYSHGLEKAVDETLVHDEETLHHWLAGLISHGAPWNDSVLLAESWRRARDCGSVDEIAEIGLAMSVSAERYLETMAQGEAFLSAVENWPLPDNLDRLESAPLPVAVGAVCGACDISLKATLIAALQAFVNNQLQAAIRLSVLGQKGAARAMARLETLIIAIASSAVESSLDDLGGVAIQADIVSMNHEIQAVRLFRS